jgi:hypothetical protein
MLPILAREVSDTSLESSKMGLSLGLTMQYIMSLVALKTKYRHPEELVVAEDSVSQLDLSYDHE